MGMENLVEDVPARLSSRRVARVPVLAGTPAPETSPARKGPFAVFAKANLPGSWFCARSKPATLVMDVEPRQEVASRSRAAP